MTNIKTRRYIHIQGVLAVLIKLWQPSNKVRFWFVFVSARCSLNNQGSSVAVCFICLREQDWSHLGKGTYYMAANPGKYPLNEYICPQRSIGGLWFTFHFQNVSFGFENCHMWFLFCAWGWQKLFS